MPTLCDYAASLPLARRVMERGIEQAQACPDPAAAIEAVLDACRDLLVDAVAYGVPPEHRAMTVQLICQDLQDAMVEKEDVVSIWEKRAA